MASILSAIRALNEKVSLSKPHTVRLGQTLDEATERRARSLGRSVPEHLRILAFVDSWGHAPMLPGYDDEGDQHSAAVRGGKTGLTA